MLACFDWLIFCCNNLVLTVLCRFVSTIDITPLCRPTPSPNILFPCYTQPWSWRDYTPTKQWSCSWSYCGRAHYRVVVMGTSRPHDYTTGPVMVVVMTTVMCRDHVELGNKQNRSLLCSSSRNRSTMWNEGPCEWRDNTFNRVSITKSKQDSQFWILCEWRRLLSCNVERPKSKIFKSPFSLRRRFSDLMS